MYTLWLAASAADTAREIGSISPGAPDYLRLLAVLAGLILLAFITARFWLPGIAGRRAPAHGPLRIAARLPLEPRRTLYIVHAAGEYMLLAASESGIRRLGALDAPGVERALREVAGQPRPEWPKCLKNAGTRLRRRLKKEPPAS